MAETAIQWTGYSWNPWRGCSKVAEGCRFCYAEKNVGVKLHGVKWGTKNQGGTRVVAAESYWSDPAKWNRKAQKEGQRFKVFCASLADVFEDWTGDIVDHKGRTAWKDGIGHWYGERPSATARKVTLDNVRKRLFETIDNTPNLDWQLLTKRPENIRRMWEEVSDPVFNWNMNPVNVPDGHKGIEGGVNHLTYRNNVWLGTSIANQEDAEKNIPELLRCRDLASKLFLSIEPMIGPIDLTKMSNGMSDTENEFINALTGDEYYGSVREGENPVYSNHGAVDWVIVGGESGPNARPCNIEWIRSIVRQCKEAGVACFVKQLGARPFMSGSRGERFNWPCGFLVRNSETWLKLDDKKGGDWNEWPEDLKVREFPLEVS